MYCVSSFVYSFIHILVSAGLATTTLDIPFRHSLDIFNSVAISSHTCVWVMIPIAMHCCALG